MDDSTEEPEEVRDGAAAPDPAEEVADRLLGSALGFLDVLSVALGDRLGYYGALAHPGPRGMTARDLAAAAGTAERYAREWLEQQAVIGLAEVAETRVTGMRGYRLAPGVAEVLASDDALTPMAPLARQLAAAARLLPAVAAAFRTGEGVPWVEYGADMRESQGDTNRPSFLHSLPGEWLAALPDVRERLMSSDPPARIADVGCGAGWSSVGIARGFPQVVVDAYDLDAASVELARRNVAEAGLEDRVRVHHEDIGLVASRETYDLVMAFECVHDLPDPVGALASMRRLADPDGTVLIADMKVAERFTAPGDAIERLMYGFSVFICLPDSMSATTSAATGTVIREPIMREYADRAGFGVVETLPVEHDMWRFYRMTP
jgi:2-polyprenyl-3-methyl-5-hydroxy-6-metoxy-1,4-benzoquinol methylase